MKCINTRPIDNERGLTLVELMVALALAAIVSVALVSTFTSHSRAQAVQENVIAMQQNLRAALYLMGRDLRMAGYRGPNPESAPAAGFLSAGPDSLSFTLLDDDTGNLTTIAYDYVDSDSDGAKDAIERNGEIVAENIDGVEFYYTLSDESKTTAPATPGNVRSVELTVLARTNRTDRDFSNTRTYTTASDATWTVNDGHRRRLGQSVILCRNM